MFLHSIKKTLLVASLVCLPAAASYAADHHIPPGQQVPFSLSCSSGNFTGVVEGVMGNHFQVGKWVHTTRYKITRSNGQSGGNKANINLYAAKSPNYGEGKASSPDSMKQDGNWHDLNLTRQNMGVGSAEVELYYEFIFDKSGSDPRCSTRSKTFT